MHEIMTIHYFLLIMKNKFLEAVLFVRHFFGCLKRKLNKKSRKTHKFYWPFRTFDVDTVLARIFRDAKRKGTFLNMKISTYAKNSCYVWLWWPTWRVMTRRFREISLSVLSILLIWIFWVWTLKNKLLFLTDIMILIFCD